MRAERPGLFYFIGGKTFLPRGDSNVPPDFLGAKRDAFIDSFNEIGTTALGVSAGDLVLPLSEWERLAAKSRFPFLSTNLAPVGKSIFRSHLRIKAGDQSVLVISISNPKSALSGEWTWREPKEALSAIFSEQAKSVDYAVLLTDIPREQSAELARLFPKIRLVLGDEDLEPTPEEFGTLLEASTLQNQSVSSGRGLGWVDFLDGRGTVLFNAARADAQRIYQDILKSRLAETRGLKGSDRASMQSALARYKNIPTEYAPGMVRYEVGTVRLTPDWANPPNALTEKVRQFKSRIREIALDSVD